MRTEFIFTHIGTHPMYLLRHGQGDVLIERNGQAPYRQSHRLSIRSPLVVRMSDFRTNEFRGLKGGDEVEPVGEQPDDRLARRITLHLACIRRRLPPRMQSDKESPRRIRTHQRLVDAARSSAPHGKSSTSKQIMASEGLIQQQVIQDLDHGRSSGRRLPG
jgi:hypothetical protein